VVATAAGGDKGWRAELQQRADGRWLTRATAPLHPHGAASATSRSLGRARRRSARTSASRSPGEEALPRGAIIPRMSDGQEERWSPARDPYAIAVSQAWWAFQAVLLFAADARNASGPAQQIYARQIFGQLRALRRCAEMQAKELVRLGVSDVDRACLDRAIEEFDVAVPNARHARDLLEHFDEYARGEGKLQRKTIRELGIDVYEAAAMYWGDGYDPKTEQITEGPFVIDVPQAVEAVGQLSEAIYAAGRAVDGRGPK